MCNLYFVEDVNFKFGEWLRSDGAAQRFAIFAANFVTSQLAEF